MPTRQLKPIAKSAYLVTIANLDGYWTDFKGGKLTYDSSEVIDGLSNQTITVKGTKKIENITLMKPYDNEADASILSFLEAATENDEPFTVTVQSGKYTPDFEPVGNAYTFLGCKILELSAPEVTKPSADAQTIELTLSVERRTYG